LYGSIASPFLARPVDLPLNTHTIGIGSAVLGGAGKTWVAIAYTQAIHAAGARVAFVAHGHGAQLPAPLIRVQEEDARTVGDDTVVARHALRDLDVPVWVGANRSDALRAAAREASVIVVDGLLQTRPRALDRSVLVLDANHPFGSGACPPSGDLRGPILRLLSLCDEAVVVRDELDRDPAMATSVLNQRVPSVRTAWLGVTGLRCGTAIRALQGFLGKRVGFASLMARPERVLHTLRLRGIIPVCVWHGSDHRGPSQADQAHLRRHALKHSLDAWLVSTKCETHFASCDIGAPYLAIELTSRLDPSPHQVLDSRPCVHQSVRLDSSHS